MNSAGGMIADVSVGSDDYGVYGSSSESSECYGDSVSLGGSSSAGESGVDGSS